MYKVQEDSPAQQAGLKVGEFPFLIRAASKPDISWKTDVTEMRASDEVSGGSYSTRPLLCLPADVCVRKQKQPTVRGNTNMTVCLLIFPASKQTRMGQFQPTGLASVTVRAKQR